MPLPEASFFALADELPVGITLTAGLGGHLVYQNRAFRLLAGIEDPPRTADSSALSYRLRDSKGAPYADELLPSARAWSTGAPVTVTDLVVHRPDGSNQAVWVTAVPIALPISGEDGAPWSHVVSIWKEGGASEDARIAAQAEVAQVQRRLLEVVNHAPVILFAINRDGLVTLAKGRALASLGIQAEQMRGVSLFDLYRDNAHALRNLRRALAGESFTDTVELGPLVFETWYAPIAGPDGGMLAVATDVTERRRMQATLLAAERMVSVGTIAASVAHEINNPLSYVVACVDLLGRDGVEVTQLVSQLEARYPADAEVATLKKAIAKLAEPFDNVRDGVERMRLIARDLRTFARTEEREVASVDVHEVLRSAVRMSSNETRYRANIVTDFGEVSWALASEPRLAQVFLNVLVNAAQAFPEGARAADCQIQISTAQRDDRVYVTVHDNGVGIAPAILPKIFEPFFTTKPVGVGTGLGLAVCRNIVESYGGTITANSELGRGTTFTIALPVAPAGSSAARPRRKEASHEPGDPLVRILVVDDDHILGNAFRMTLAQEFSVTVVTSGACAIEQLSDRNGAQFDFVFCDLMMPHLTGMDVFAELSRKRPEVLPRIFFMTGGAFSQEIRQFIARVPNRCLQKPFDPVSVVRDALLADRQKTG